MLEHLNPQFDEDTEKMLVDESRAIAAVIAHLGFYTKDGQRIELDMPLPLPLARHWAERGMRYHPELAVIKPAKSEQGEQVWVPKTGDEPEAPQTLEEIPEEQIDELRNLVQMLTDRIDEAEKLRGAGGGAA